MRTRHSLISVVVVLFAMLVLISCGGGGGGGGGGNGNAPAPNISVNKTVLFGQVIKGSTSDQTITVTNSGNADLIISTLASSDSLTAPFGITAENCSGQTLLSAGTCTLTVRFSPAAKSAFNDSFDIPSNDPDTPICTVSLSGTGISAPVSRVSVSSDGTQGNNVSLWPSVSSDGRYVAFQSTASNLVSGDTNGMTDVFVHDTQTGDTVRVSVTSAGTQANGFSNDPSISADGRYVAFDSTANLESGDTNGLRDVYVHDRDSDADGIFDEAGAITTTRVSVATSGQTNNASNYPSISNDGRYVAFQSTATNLVAGDTNGFADVFVRDLQGATTTRVSIASDGTTQAAADCLYPSISGDGRHVAFRSYATNLVTGDTNATYDIFVHDTQTGATTRVSVATAGTEANGSSANAAISGNGRYIAFDSTATNLVPGDTSISEDVFVRDRDTDDDGIFDEGGAVSTTRISVSAAGSEANSGSSNPSISSDGRYVAFYSFATNIVATDTNGEPDFFIHDRDVDNDGSFDEAGAISNSLVSVSAAGTQANMNGYEESSISGDGQYVAFESNATNLVAGDTNAQVDIFIGQ